MISVRVCNVCKHWNTQRAKPPSYIGGTCQRIFGLLLMNAGDYCSRWEVKEPHTMTLPGSPEQQDIRDLRGEIDELKSRSANIIQRVVHLESVLCANPPKVKWRE